MAAETSRKLVVALINFTICIGPRIIAEKSDLFQMAQIKGVSTSAIKGLTTYPKKLPIITATLRSTTFPH